MSTIDRRDLLLQAGVALASELSLPIVLQRIVDLAVEVTDARYGALGVIDADRRRLSQFITSGISARERAAIGALPEGRGILGILINDARPLRLADIAVDPRSVGFPANHPPMHTFLGAPVMAMGRVFGNLYLTEKRSGGPFSEQDELDLRMLATQAGVAIANATLYEQARAREAWLDATRQVSSAILSGVDPESTLSLICRHARELVDADTSTVITADTSGELVISAADGNRSRDLLGLHVPRHGSISGHAMASGRPVLVADASRDERAYQPMVAAGGMGPALFVPLVVDGGAFGTLAVANRVGGPAIIDAQARIVEAFAEQAAIAYDYGRARRDAQRFAILEDRERIAKDMHDGVIQSLFAVGMNLQAIGLTAGGAVEARLEHAVDEIDRVIRDLRNYIFGLRPGLLADRQLAQAIRELADDFAARTHVDTQVEIDPEVAAALAPRSADVVQFVREALSNAGRHAAAGQVSIALAREGMRAALVVADDGQGFDVKKGNRGQGLGNLENRVRRMGGSLRIASRPGRGTRLRASIPLR